MLYMGAPAFVLKLFAHNLGGSRISTSAEVVSNEDQTPRQNGSLKDTTPLLLITKQLDAEKFEYSKFNFVKSKLKKIKN